MIYKISCQICGDHFDASKIAGHNDSVSVSGDGIVTCDGEPFGTDYFRQDCEKKFLDFIQNNDEHHPPCSSMSSYHLLSLPIPSYLEDATPDDVLV